MGHVKGEKKEASAFNFISPRYRIVDAGLY